MFVYISVATFFDLLCMGGATRKRGAQRNKQKKRKKKIIHLIGSASKDLYFYYPCFVFDLSHIC